MMKEEYAMLTFEEVDEYLIEREIDKVNTFIKAGRDININSYIHAYKEKLIKMNPDDKLRYYEYIYMQYEYNMMFDSSIHLDKLRFFNRPNAKADFDHYLRLVTWTREEAVALCFGKDPKIVNYDSLSMYLAENTDDLYAKYSGFIKDYLGVREILLSDLEVHEKETPVFFLSWFNKARVMVDDVLQQKSVQHGLMPASSYDWIENEMVAALDGPKASSNDIGFDLTSPVESLSSQAPLIDEVDDSSLTLRSKNNYLRIIGALLTVIEGDTNGLKRHPQYRNQSAFIKLLEEKFYERGIKGLSESHLAHLFPIAKRAIKP